jgi:hypothetical protein
MKAATVTSRFIALSFDPWRIVVDDKAYKRERRRQARLERLCSNNPICLLCSENDPGCLEAHHVAGREFSDICVCVCFNHHQKLSDRQAEHPPILPGDPTLCECRGRLLLGITDIMELSGAPSQLIEFVRNMGLSLIEDGQLNCMKKGE